MRILLQAPGCVTVSVEGCWAAGQLEAEVERRLGIPEGKFQLQWKGKELRDPQFLSDLSEVRVHLKLPGGIYYPEDNDLSMKELHQLICRRCYCRNSYDRRSCRKCGHPDLRSRKNGLYPRNRDSNPNRPKS